MTLVKVCGLTRDEDVRAAVELGAWAVGFVLTASPRHVDRAQAGGLAAHAGDALTVGVVATEEPAWIAHAVTAAGLRVVQLSGGVDGPSVADILAATAHLLPRPLIIAAADTVDAKLADFILLDARAPGHYGGTGRRLDWGRLAADPGTPREDLVLAGGLTPANVAAAIGALRPVAVDVSSGVEYVPGIKDPGKLRDFFHAAERADVEAAAQGACAGKEAE